MMEGCYCYTHSVSYDIRSYALLKARRCRSSGVELRVEDYDSG